MADDKIRQYDAVLPSLKKNEALHKIYQMPGFVGDPSSGGTFQLTKAGEQMKVSVMANPNPNPNPNPNANQVSVMAKLVILAANKFSILDPLGMRIEMEP